MTTPNRRRTDRIREICARMLDAPEEELPMLNAKLREALVEHSLQLENLAMATALGLPKMPAERRRRTAKIIPEPSTGVTAAKIQKREN